MNVIGMFSRDVGIDLGTANTVLYVRGEGIVLNEPSIVAIRRDGHVVLAVGNDAKRMLGRTPGTIDAIRPMKDGVIADFDITESMLRYFIRRVHDRRTLISPRIVIAVPAGITEVERRAVKDSAERAGARKVYCIDEPMAAAIGCGLPVHEPAGNMIIDIGGGTTEVAVMSLSGIVFSRSVRIGGDELDEAIVAYMKRVYNLMVGERTAEEIKIAIGSAYPLAEELTLDIRGRDLGAGLPKSVVVTSQEIRQAMSDPIESVIGAVRYALERCPPELSADLIDRGIVMSGGGALLRGIDKLVEEETGLSVHVADDPLSAVALGTGKIIEDEDLLHKIAIQDV
ncbi:MAG: rod shape-determining protein [bacterium]|nr:rod shape-determining protein [bacterium]